MRGFLTKFLATSFLGKIRDAWIGGTCRGPGERRKTYIMGKSRLVGIVFDKYYLQVEVCGERFLKWAFPTKAVKQNANLTLMILTRQNISEDVD